MTDLWEHVATALVTAVGIAVLGAVVTRLRSRRRRRARSVDVAGSVPTPPDEFGVWTFHGPLLGRRRDRLRVRPGLVAWFDGDALQPRWEVAAGRVVLEVKGPGRVVDTVRVALTGPDGRRRVRVGRGPQRPLGELDTRYEAELAEDLRELVEAMEAAGAEVRLTGRAGRT